ncbi:hypothetical protein [Peteryoungia ipomoeae]|uniref:Uncharacterized protein n=1 Tax=Peteryoungia ipomoeae TaxID=1210932 RepID=A0A4S8P1A7_9HYPH|nr:hypothetical protein [Peteryoungia ipomoeae]THV21329.1 hypothetical protein FAA97_14995 [Peteryoungia ipomoeae]
MVKRVSRIYPGEASNQAEVGHTLNLGSDPLNTWVSARQSKINHDIEERRRTAPDEHADHGSAKEQEAEHGHPSRHLIEPDDTRNATECAPEEPRLSGESERIGTQNFDEDTPFGDRVAII